MPRVSFCTPVLNMGEWLKITIASVIAQTYTDWEMCIVDDGSTDDITGIVASFNDERIRLKVLPVNCGVAVASNAAFRMAQGEYINALSADEWVMPDKLHDQVRFLDEHPNVACVFGLPTFIGDGPDAAPPTKTQYELGAYNRSRQDWLQTLLSVDRVPLASCSSLYRRSVWDEVGFYDERLRITTDLELYIRMATKWDLHILPVFNAGCRIRTDGISSLNKESAIRMREEMQLVHAKHGGDGKAKINYKGKVVIATPFYEQRAYSPYVKSLVQTTAVLSRLGVNWDFWPAEGFSYVDQARNILCARFIEDESCTDLVFIDADEDWDTMGLLRLLMAPYEVVGASYPMKNDWLKWTAQLHCDADGQPLGVMQPDGGALMEADSLPAGFLRIRRSALVKFRDAYPELAYCDPTADITAPDRQYTAFFERFRDGGACYGEDVMFSRRWKAIGGQLWVEPRVSINHYGMKGYFGNLDGYLRTAP